MPQKTVPLVTGEVYHVFNRGVDKRVIFNDKHDYLRFYQSLDLFNDVQPVINFRLAQSGRNQNRVRQELVAIHAYALIPNHFHLILEQLVDGGLSEFMLRVGGGYTSYFNEGNERSGSLFQGTYKRVHISTDDQYRYTLAYVNENHIVHGNSMVREVCHSSSLHYTGAATSRLISGNLVENYDAVESVRLAREIFARRKEKGWSSQYFDSVDE